MRVKAISLSKLNKKKTGLLLALILIIFFVGLGIYLYNNQFKDSKEVTAGTEDVIVQIGKLIELPTNEAPALATVTDKAKLGDRPFFEKAENGDKFLVYKNSKMAILYRPSLNKIIKVGTINIEDTPDSTQTPDSVTPGAQSEVKLVVYNGTKTAGLAKSVGADLESKFTNITVVKTKNSTGEFTKNLIVDVTGKNKALAQSIAKELGGEVGSLPEAEEKPTDADILVILGN